jgi:MYXO-CTERM domain-containing protein
MARRPRLARLTALAPLAIAALVSPSALAWTPIDGAQPRWQGFPVFYKVNEASLPSSIASIGVARVDAGFAAWGAPDCTSFATMNAGDTNLSNNYNDNQNVIRWESQSWKQSYGPVDSVIGVTAPVWQDQTWKIVDADIVFNNVGFKWNDTGSMGFVDTQSIATHEEGHFLGLGHSSAKNATMYASYSGGTALRVLSQDDVAGVCALYPSGTTTGTTTGTSTSTGGESCDSCVASSQQSGGACTGAASACGKVAACVALNNCLSTCTSQSCVDACDAKNPDGVAPYDAFVACVCQACANPCAEACGTGTSTGTTTSSPTGGGGGTTATGTHGVGGGAPTGAGGAALDDLDDGNDDGFLQMSESGAGCGCIVGSSSTGAGAQALAVLAGLVALLRRRRSA